MGLSRFSFVGAVALTMMSVGVPVPAAADDHVDAKHGTAYVDTVDGVLYEECYAHTYSYGITLAPNTASWSMVVAVDDPSGVVATDVFSSGENPPLSGTRTVELCGDTDKAGAFTLRATLIDRVGFYQDITHLTPDAFTMRKPFTTTELKASKRRPRAGHRARLRITSMAEHLGAYLPHTTSRVYLERRQGGTWVKIRGSGRWLDEHGRVRLKPTMNTRGKVKIRAVTRGTGNYAKSRSRPVTLRVRPPRSRGPHVRGLRRVLLRRLPARRAGGGGATRADRAGRVDDGDREGRLAQPPRPLVAARGRAQAGGAADDPRLRCSGARRGRQRGRRARRDQ
jgi:hypothetical protein